MHPASEGEGVEGKSEREEDWENICVLSLKASNFFSSSQLARKMECYQESDVRGPGSSTAVRRGVAFW